MNRLGKDLGLGGIGTEHQRNEIRRSHFEVGRRRIREDNHAVEQLFPRRLTGLIDREEICRIARAATAGQPSPSLQALRRGSELRSGLLSEEAVG